MGLGLGFGGGVDVLVPGLGRAVTEHGPESVAVISSARATNEENYLVQKFCRVAIGTMHLAKGLEFKAVAVMACDDDVLPLLSRIEQASDESELDEVYDTERHLLYVACTRARDQVVVTGVEPASEFLEDMNAAAERR